MGKIKITIEGESTRKELQTHLRNLADSIYSEYINEVYEKQGIEYNNESIEKSFEINSEGIKIKVEESIHFTDVLKIITKITKGRKVGIA